MRLAPAEPNDTSELRRTTSTGLPPALVQRGAAQLCWVGMITATASVTMWTLVAVFLPELALLHHNWFTFTHGFALILVSIGLVIVNRLGLLSANSLVWVGMGYEVFGAFAIATFEYAAPWTDASPVRGISVLAVWIAVCGLLLPQPPLRSLVTGMAAATMGPLAYWVAKLALHNPPAPLNQLWFWFFGPYLLAFWTAVLNRRLYRLEIHASRMKEMGSYELKTLLGRGGMGEVWRATHRLLAFDAAVKLIRPEVLVAQTGRQASVVQKRFEKEARATAALTSPHTIRLYDFGVSEDGSFYYVMELLDGINLEQLVRRFGPQPAGRVARILRQACDSLGEAHLKGMVHRDIKPSNIFLCRLGMSVDFVKVVDFGLVKSVTGEEETRMTLDGATTGTPAYMAPEVALGNRDIDGRVDIYGLGCVAYWLLTGHLLFDHKSPVAMALAHIQESVIPPSQRSEMPIHPGLERIILDCLSKDPDQRPRSALELAERLDALQDIEPWTSKHAMQWWKVHLPCCAWEASAGESGQPVREVSANV